MTQRPAVERPIRKDIETCDSRMIWFGIDDGGSATQNPIAGPDDQKLSESRAFRRLPAAAQQITTYKLSKHLINKQLLFLTPPIAGVAENRLKTAPW